jgi:O-antigen ligase
MNKFQRPTPNLAITRNMVLIVLTIIFSLIIGTSFFVIPSIYAPLIVFASVIAVIALFSWIKKPVWALYFSLFVVLLPTSLLPATVNSYLNRIATVIALVVWLIDVLRQRSRVILSTSTLFMFVFIAWAGITLLWAEDLTIGWNVLQKYVLRLVLFLLLIVNEIKTNKNLDGLMNTLALSGLLMVVVSGVTILTQGYSSGTRLSVLDVNENELGISLLISLQGILWWASRPSKHSGAIKKWLAAIFLLACIGLTGLSGSRGSAISLVITLSAFLIWKPTRSWGILGFIIIGLAVIVAPIVFSTTITRFLGTAGETTLGGRETLWLAGLDLLKDHFIMGVGIGNSPYQLIPYLGNIGGLSLKLLRTVEFSVHNPVMAIWAETGFFGLFIYLGVFVSAIISFVRQYLLFRRIRYQYLIPYYAIVSSVFCGYIVSWIKGGGTESDFYYFLMLALLWIPFCIQERSPD